jgi:hypothetical protein
MKKQFTDGDKTMSKLAAIYARCSTVEQFSDTRSVLFVNSQNATETP